MKDELAKLDAHQAARRLLGCELVRSLGSHRLVGRIVETESYEETDPAAHSYGGPRGRNLIMYGPAGKAYVYFTYGMHYCLNVVTGEEGHGEAVLIRAIEPLAGEATMLRNRHLSESSKLVTNGPAKLTQALAINAELNGHDLAQAPLQLILRRPVADEAVTVTTRIGIRHSASSMQRFYITGSQFVSRP